MKQIPLAELNQIKKIMGMTTSIHDGEALNAIRKVNSMMAKHKITWADFFERTISTESHPAYTSYGRGPNNNGTKRHEYSDPSEDEMDVGDETDLHSMIKAAFDELRGVDLGNFRSFIDSLENQYLAKKYLTPSQRKPLFETVKRHRERRRR